MASETTRPAPDCATCWKFEECGRAQAGTFCPQWQSKEPKPAGKDPNDAWRQGDEPAF